VLDCSLTEELKWKQPCYTFKNKNILMIGGFKENCFISFFKGILLQDQEGLLVSPGENSQSVRMMKFTNSKEISDISSLLKSYIYEAIEVEKAGLRVAIKKAEELILIDELKEALTHDSKLNDAFKALTPGRQRAYNIFFSGAKQASTRISRIDNYKQRILNGKGFNDCTCGLSKRMPTCDGSHKVLKS
jgi:uncharacterized protein YdeI (YjbR/CyaY-like superfamily)